MKSCPTIPNTTTKAKLVTVRCAIYTRKSTEEGLEKQFNSLDAQREACLAYIQSQKEQGWEAMPERYDDGGFSGGNTDRPALARLLADIELGRIDAVVVYKVDRLSRSLLDFARIMGTFEKQQVAFVSITQQFNTGSSMGRLILNVLLSFAQFEREMIAERTRDKMSAARRKGKWAGGRPVLGYDVDPSGPKLVVNEREAQRVRTIFQLYLEHRALGPVVQELKGRGWRNKRFVSRNGTASGGKPFTKTTLHSLLTSVVYIGKVRHKNHVYEGEHRAIVEAYLWQSVQSMLNRAGARSLSGQSAPLGGILHCAACGCTMSHSHTSKGGKQHYRYYVCSRAQQEGWSSCPSQSLPAAEIERVVLERVGSLAKDPLFLKAYRASRVAGVEKANKSVGLGEEALELFEALWELLDRQEQVRVMQLLVARVDYDGSKGKLSMTFHPSVIETVAEELSRCGKELG